MKLSKIILLSIFVILLMPQSPLSPLPAAAKPIVVELTAGRNIDVGQIDVWNDNEYLYVKYSAVGGWLITETHLSVMTQLASIPQTKNGGPIPGKFEYRKMFSPGVGSYTFTLPLEPEWLTSALYIAAHAIVQKTSGETTRSETAWGGDLEFPGKNWARYFKYLPQLEREWPKEGSAYIGYEDLRDMQDFDYNDWGMTMTVKETYTVSGVEEISLKFRGMIHSAVYRHHIHLMLGDGVSGTVYLKEYSGDGVTVVRDITASFTGSIDVQVFDDTEVDLYHYTVISIVFDSPATPLQQPPYDPYIEVVDTGMTYHSWDTILATMPAGQANIPRILVIPVGWMPPMPGYKVWTVYGYFDDYYVSGGFYIGAVWHTDWYNYYTGPNPAVPSLPYP